LLKGHDSLLLYSGVIGIKGDTNTQNRAKQGHGKKYEEAYALRGGQGHGKNYDEAYALCARRANQANIQGREEEG